LLGYSREEMLTKKIDDITAPELRQPVPETFAKYVLQGHLNGEYTLLTKDGRHVPILHEALVFPDGCMTARWHPLKKPSP
jgi:PAS domain S-box-containing protein